VAALCGVIAMAVQNAASRTVFSELSPTTVMTGNVTQIVLDCVDLLDAMAPGRRLAIRARLNRLWPPVVGFAAGAAAGAIGFAWEGFVSLLIPAGLVLVLATRAFLNGDP